MLPVNLRSAREAEIIPQIDLEEKVVPAIVSRAVREAPALHLEALPGVITALAAFLASATPAEQAAAWSLATIGGGIASGLVKRPAHVALTSSVVVTVLGNLAVLGLHLPQAWAAVALAVASALPASAQARPPAAPPPPASPLAAPGLMPGEQVIAAPAPEIPGR